MALIKYGCNISPVEFFTAFLRHDTDPSHCILVILHLPALYEMRLMKAGDDRTSAYYGDLKY